MVKFKEKKRMGNESVNFELLYVTDSHIIESTRDI